MGKLAQAGEGGGARPPPFTLFSITYKVAVYAPAERAGTLPLFHLYPYVLCGQSWYYQEFNLMMHYPKVKRHRRNVTLFLSTARWVQYNQKDIEMLFAQKVMKYVQPLLY